MDLGGVTMFATTNVPDGRYFIRVRSTNGAGTGAASNEVLLTISGPCTAAPAPPLLSSTVDGASIALSWTAPEGAVTGYRLEAGFAPGSTTRPC